MSGEENIFVLLKTMRPELNEGDYVFCTADEPLKNNTVACLCTFREKEGTTMILKKDDADQAGISYSFVAAWITLTVHSSLEAVGLTAAVANAFARENISCNVVAAYYHDHIFVPKKDAQRAMEILLNLSRG